MTSAINYIPRSKYMNKNLLAIFSSIQNTVGDTYEQSPSSILYPDKNTINEIHSQQQ